MNDRVMKAKYPGRCRCSSNCHTFFPVGALIKWDKNTKRTALVEHMEKLKLAQLETALAQLETALAQPAPQSSKPNGRGVGELSVRKLEL